MTMDEPRHRTTKCARGGWRKPRGPGSDSQVDQGHLKVRPAPTKEDPGMGDWGGGLERKRGPSFVFIVQTETDWICKRKFEEKEVRLMHRQGKKKAALQTKSAI